MKEHVWWHVFHRHTSPHKTSVYRVVQPVYSVLAQPRIIVQRATITCFCIEEHVYKTVRERHMLTRYSRVVVSAMCSARPVMGLWRTTVLAVEWVCSWWGIARHAYKHVLCHFMGASREYVDRVTSRVSNVSVKQCALAAAQDYIYHPTRLVKLTVWLANINLMVNA